MIESGFEKEQRERTEMFARWDVDSALFKAGIGKTRKEDIALVNAAQNKYNSLVDGGIKRGNLGLLAGLGERELDIENQRTGILKQEANAQTMNAETNRLGAITGLSSGLGQPRQQRQTLPGFSSIAPSRLQTSSPFARQRIAGVEAASESEIEDDVDPMRPRAYKNGGVIGNVKKDDGSDKVPVVAREGEYYINPETVAHIGGGDYKQGLRSLNALVREATGKEPGPSPVGKSGLRGFAAGGYVDLDTLRKLPRAAREAVINSEVAANRRIGPGQIAAENVPKRDALIPRSVPANQQLVPVKQPSVREVTRRLNAGTNSAPRPTLSDAKGWYRQGVGNVPPAGEAVRIPTSKAPNFTMVNGVPEGQQLVPMEKPKATKTTAPKSGARPTRTPDLKLRGAPINRADIATTVNVEPTQARVEAPKRGLIQGAKGAGGRALAFLSSPAVVGASLMAHSGDAGDQNEDAWATQQRANWGKPLAEGAEPWNNPLPYDTPITANAAREQALRLEPSRSQADEYSNSPERAAWQASLGNGQPTSSQPETADDFRTRKAAADVYRREWQRQSPGGLRNANPDALTLYNAEQQVRGTGISAQRQANGVMEFSGSGPAPKAQYLDAGGTPTNEWQDTSQYRDAVVRSLGSSDPAMQQRGLAQAMQLQQRNQRGVVTGDPRMDDLLSKMEPREAAAVYRALYGGQGADGKGPKAAPYAEQQKRVIDALGEEGAAKAMQEIQQAQMQMARQLIQSGQATPEQAEAAVQNPQFITRLTNAYKLREFLAQNGQWGEAASGAGGWGTAAGLAAGGLTLGLTRNPGVAAKAAAAGGALGAGIGGAQGFTQGAQGFDAAMPLTELMNITPLPDGDYQIGNAVIPKAMVQKNYQLFGLTAPPK